MTKKTHAFENPLKANCNVSRNVPAQNPVIDSSETNRMLQLPVVKNFAPIMSRKLPFRYSNKLTSKLQRTANEYAAKRRIYERPDQQKYTLSGHTEFCKADGTT